MSRIQGFHRSGVHNVTVTTELGGQRCARTVRGLITAGRLGPGEQLVEQSLVEVCGVSRNTLREGYRILADEGLVVHVPHRGVFVSSPGVAEVRDVYTARRVVECGALRERAGAGLAVGGGPAAGGDPAVVVLEQLVGRAREAAADGRWSEVGDLNMAVHQQWVDLAGSRWLSAAAKGLLAHARLAFRTLADPGGLHSAFVEENARVVGHVAAGEFGAAADLLEGYLHRAEGLVVDAMR
ncbi:Uncharacterized HTH-type transcriptional regulator ydfH [Kytococcus sedentarius]|nr:Uncharacterized HTH-type transcriptional regulator ydfH [Kytococcus sedentarius]